MDFNDAFTALRKANPDCAVTDLRAALDSEVMAVERGLLGKRKYESAVEIAYNRIVLWLKEGNECNVELTWKAIAHFTASRRPACVYCTMIAKSRSAK